MSHIKHRVASVDIYQGDDLHKLTELHQKAKAAKKRYLEAVATRTLMNDDDEGMAEAQDAYDTFLDIAVERAVTFDLRSIGSKRWRTLKKDHPPRQQIQLVNGTEQQVVIEDDQQFGVNTETLPYALLGYVDARNTDVRTITAPAYTTTDELTEELEEMAGGDLDRLWTAAYYLNDGLGADPKAARFSATPPPSDETSG